MRPTACSYYLDKEGKKNNQEQDNQIKHIFLEAGNRAEDEMDNLHVADEINIKKKSFI